MEYVDRILKCADCAQDFVFTAGEQLFFNDKQFKNDPKRCKSCKSKRAGLHLSERFFEELLYLGCFNVTKDIDHTVLRDYVTVAEIGQIFLRQVLHSFDRAV